MDLKNDRNDSDDINRRGELTTLITVTNINSQWFRQRSLKPHLSTLTADIHFFFLLFSFVFKKYSISLTQIGMPLFERSENESRMAALGIGR